MARLSVSAYGITHPGHQRSHNEDAFLIRNQSNLWVVADGLGGHEQGEIASHLIVNALGQIALSRHLQTNIQTIVQTLQQVNTDLISRSSEQTQPSLIGSTVCVLFLHETYCICIWSGDSRIYRYRQHDLTVLTQDHNYVAAFMEAGFSEQEALSYPLAQQLTKAVGAERIWGFDIQMYEYQQGDIFLLCSDGLFTELEHATLLNVLKQPQSLATIGQSLLAQVLAGQAKDNVTLVLVQV